jgi:hypothetical protein
MADSSHEPGEQLAPAQSSAAEPVQAEAKSAPTTTLPPGSPEAFVAVVQGVVNAATRLFDQDANTKHRASEHAAQMYREELATLERVHVFDARLKQRRFFSHVASGWTLTAAIIGVACLLIVKDHVQEGVLVLSHAAAVAVGLLGGRALRDEALPEAEIPSSVGDQDPPSK